MMPDVDVHDDVTLSLDGPTIRACHEILTNEETATGPFDTDLHHIDEKLRNADRPSLLDSEKEWNVTLTQMEWVTLYGCFYTTEDATDDQQQALLALLAEFPEPTERLAEHTRDFYDAVNKELE